MGKKYNTETLEAAFQKAELETLLGSSLVDKTRHRLMHWGVEVGAKASTLKKWREYSNEQLAGKTPNKTEITGFHMKTVYRWSIHTKGTYKR